MLFPHVGDDYVELKRINGIEVIMESWKTCRIYCYSLEFENVAKVRNPKETFLVNFAPVNRKLSKDAKA